MIEMERDRDGDRLGQLAPHRVHDIHPGHDNVLDRGLDDDRRAQLFRGRQDCLHGEIVDDVDRRNTVALFEGALRGWLWSVRQAWLHLPFR